MDGGGVDGAALGPWAKRQLAPDEELMAREDDILAHMNSDHAENLRAYCRHAHAVETTQATMIGIDPDGFDVRCENAGEERVLRFDFAAPVTDARQAREALVALAQAART